MTNKMDTDEGGSSDQGVTESPELTSSTVVVVVPKLDEAGEQPKQMEGPKEEASQILAVKQPYVDEPPATESVVAEQEPCSSIAFAQLTIDDELKELLRMVENDADALNDLLNVENSLQEPISAFLQSVRSETPAKRISYLVSQAQNRNLLYSYCNLFFVANPYLRLYPELIDYNRFIESAKQNWSIVVEPAVLPAGSKPPITNLKKQDAVDVVLKRMKDLSLTTAATPKPVVSGPVLNGEKLLLLDLLSLREDQRDQFIIECAISQRLLVTNSQTGFLELDSAINGMCFEFLDVNKAVQTANQLTNLSSGSTNVDDGPDFIVESEVLLVAPKVASANDAKTEAAKSVSDKTNKTSAKDDKDEGAVSVTTSKAVKKEAAEKCFPKADQKGTTKTKSSTKSANPLPAEAITKSVIGVQNPKLIKSSTPPVVTNTNSTKKDKIPPAEAITKAEKRASRKASRKEAFSIANSNKSLETNDSAASSKIKQQIKDAEKKATQQMEQLMREYQYKRPDADPVVRGPKIERKRGARSKHVSLCSSDTYESVPQSIMSSLRNIEDVVDLHGSAGLGKLGHPKVYANFIANFECTIKRIKQKLYHNPTVAPLAPVTKAKIEKKEKPTHAPNTFKRDLQKLLQFHNCSANLDENLLNAEDNPAVLETVVQQLLEKKVGHLLEGVVRINAFNINVAYLTSSETTEDTMIETILLRQCAMQNDLVQVFAFTKLDEKRSNPSGFVTRILDKRNDRLVIGRCKTTKTKPSQLTFVPTTKRVPNLIIDKNLQATKYPLIQINEQMVYLARITGWQCETPIGEIYRMIGLHNELSTSNEAILIEHKLQVPSFSNSIMESLPSESFTIPKEEYALRENLTADYVFTIDPATARDLDDALSVEALPNGNYKVGVHISDVTYFIAEFSELDEVIRDQATSIYLVNTVYHMLPRSLCMTCSLLPGQDKLAFSVFWELTTDGKIVSTHFARTVINSCVQLAYSHAQRMIEEPQHQFAVEELPTIREGFEASVIAEKVRLLHKLATPLRKQRLDRFCLTINQPKITFQLDEESGEPLTFERYQQMDSNWLIEEFMLLANQTVAARIYDSFPSLAILRNHSAPKETGLETLAARLQLLGFKDVDFKTPEATSRTMFRLTHEAKVSESVEAVLTEILTKPMNRALYICSDDCKLLAHFALGIPIYTHFTSPIRRYPDIMVHRLLAASIGVAETPLRTPESLQSIANRCNDQKYNAKLAGEASTDVYFMHYVKKRGTVKMYAVVLEVINTDSFEVMLLDTGMKFKIVLSKHKPLLVFQTTTTKPLSGLIKFDKKPNHPSLRVATFEPILVELRVSGNPEVLKANVVEITQQ